MSSSEYSTSRFNSIQPRSVLRGLGALVTTVGLALGPISSVEAATTKKPKAKATAVRRTPVKAAPPTTVKPAIKPYFGNCEIDFTTPTLTVSDTPGNKCNLVASGDLTTKDGKPWNEHRLEIVASPDAYMDYKNSTFFEIPNKEIWQYYNTGTVRPTSEPLPWSMEGGKLMRLNIAARTGSLTMAIFTREIYFNSAAEFPVDSPRFAVASPAGL